MLWKIPLTLVLAYVALIAMRREFLIPIAKIKTWVYLFLINITGIIAIGIINYCLPLPGIAESSFFMFSVILFAWSAVEEYIKMSAVTFANDNNKTQFSTVVASATSFAIIENFLYASASSSPLYVALRGFYGPVLHSFFSLVFVYYLRKNRQSTGFIAALVVHGLHNIFAMYHVPVADFFLCLTLFVFITINIRNEQNSDLAKPNI